MADKTFTTQDAHALGLKEGTEASQRGEELSMGMTWGGDNQDFNEAYDQGVNDAQKAFVLSTYPEAIAIQLDARTVMDGPTWVILAKNDQHAETLGESDGDFEYEAWQAAAIQIGRTS